MNFKEEPRILTQTLGRKGPPCSLKRTLVAQARTYFEFDPRPWGCFLEIWTSLFRGGRRCSANLEFLPLWACGGCG